MPYGFYQLVRFLVLVGFAFLVFQAHQEDQKTAAIIYVALAMLFQPFLKVSLGRGVWNVVDVVVGVGLLLSMVVKRHRKVSKE